MKKIPNIMKNIPKIILKNTNKKLVPKILKSVPNKNQYQKY